jgi:transposase
MKQEHGIHLSAAQRHQLWKVLKHNTQGGSATRVTAILLSDAGLSSEAVGKILGITGREVRKCRQRWRQKGLMGLENAPRQGRPVQANASYLRLLIRTLKRDPRKMGYIFSRWTAPRLSAYLAQKTGVRLSSDYVRQLLHMQQPPVVWGKSKLTTTNLADPVEKKTCGEMAQKTAKGFEITSIRF